MAVLNALASDLSNVPGFQSLAENKDAAGDPTVGPGSNPKGREGVSGASPALGLSIILMP